MRTWVLPAHKGTATRKFHAVRSQELANLLTFRWGDIRIALGALNRDGYYVREMRGTGLVHLWITGSEVSCVPQLPAASAWLREPVLERALPADVVPGSTIDVKADVEIELRDGSWVPALVTGERLDQRGRWSVHMRWWASTRIAGWQDSFSTPAKKATPAASRQPEVAGQRRETRRNG
jgi:hypothetical protein